MTRESLTSDNHVLNDSTRNHAMERVPGGNALTGQRRESIPIEPLPKIFGGGECFRKLRVAVAAQQFLPSCLRVHD